MTATQPRDSEHHKQRQHDRQCGRTNVHIGEPVWTIVCSSARWPDRSVSPGVGRKLLVYGGNVKLIRVETAADPLRPVRVLIMVRVAHRRQELLVSSRSTDVLRWAGPPTSDT